MDLLKKASEIYEKNFQMETWFERAIFISWYCATPTCKFCYMHGIKDNIKNPRKARRSLESIFAEALITKICSWEIGFVSGGIHSWSTEELKEVLEGIFKITKKKQWLNLGILNEAQIKELLPYTKGLTGTVECIHNKRDEIVPDKPLDEIESMFKLCDKYDLKKTITIIIGLGETIEDFPKLAELIKRWNIDRINFYRLVPHDNTEYKKGPDTEYYAEWIAKTRIEFPKVDIVAGSWADRMEEVPLLLKAGSNSITKLPAIKYFGKKPSILIEEGAKKAGREFKSHMIRYPKINIEKEISKLDFDSNMRKKIKERYFKYYIKLKKYES
jgi:biotin synthase-like enzyme